MPEPRKPAPKIQVITPDEIISIESKVTVREVAKAQLKVIEQSKAWQEHQKAHKDARLSVMGAAESKDLGPMEKAISTFAREATRQNETPKKGIRPPSFEEEQSRAPGQEVNVKLTGAYKSGAADNQQFSYHGGHGPGTMMASCTCGQTFKTDDDGNTQQYKIKTDVTSAGDAGSYKKSDAHHDSPSASYKKSVHEDIQETRKYGR
jgi:hypothetical protein